MGGRREQRMIEQVLPRSGEFTLGENVGLEGVGAAAVTQHDHLVADVDGRGRADGERRQVEAPERLDQAESGDEVVRERMPGDNDAAVRREPDRFGFEDQVTDGQDEPIAANHHAVAGPLGPQNRCGERIIGDRDPQRDHRVERRREVEAHLAGLRLQLAGKRPVGGFGHRWWCRDSRRASRTIRKCNGNGLRRRRT